MRVQVKNFMSTPVATTVASDKVGEVRSRMQKQGIHAMPVVEMTRKLPQNEAMIKGIITSTDLGKDVSDDTEVEAKMRQNIHIVHPDSSAKAAANMMLRKGVRHLVAMENGEIVGMVSALDFVKLVSEHTLD